MIAVHIPWAVNPFRGEKFAEAWVSAAEAALDYGAISWAFYRAVDGRLDFIQQAVFPSKAHFERYWYSERMAQYRIELAGCYQVPIIPTFWEVVGEGEAALSPARAAPS